MERDRVDPAVVSGELVEQLAITDAPYAHDAGFIPGGGESAVTAGRDLVRSALIAPEDVTDGPGLDVPEPNLPVVAAGQQALAIGEEREAEDLIAVAVKDARAAVTVSNR